MPSPEGVEHLLLQRLRALRHHLKLLAEIPHLDRRRRGDLRAGWDLPGHLELPDPRNRSHFPSLLELLLDRVDCALQPVHACPVHVHRAEEVGLSLLRLFELGAQLRQAPADPARLTTLLLGGARLLGCRMLGGGRFALLGFARVVRAPTRGAMGRFVGVPRHRDVTYPDRVRIPVGGREPCLRQTKSIVPRARSSSLPSCRIRRSTASAIAGAAAITGASARVNPASRAISPLGRTNVKIDSAVPTENAPIRIAASPPSTGWTR